MISALEHAINCNYTVSAKFKKQSDKFKQTQFCVLDVFEYHTTFHTWCGCPGMGHTTYGYVFRLEK